MYFSCIVYLIYVYLLYGGQELHSLCHLLLPSLRAVTYSIFFGNPLSSFTYTNFTAFQANLM